MQYNALHPRYSLALLYNERFGRYFKTIFNIIRYIEMTFKGQEGPFTSRMSGFEY